jgi:hypothetical protein
MKEMTVATVKNSGLLLKACGLFVLLAASAAQATLLVQEGFNYPPVTIIDGTQNGGTGFAASNWGTNNAGIVAGLSYPGLASSGSNALKKAGYARVPTTPIPARSLSPGFGGSTFYMSMVINTAGQNDYRFGFEMNGGNGPCFGRVNGGWGFFSGNNGYGGFTSTNGLSYQTWVGVPSAADSASHLIVYKFDYAANALKLYVDPFLAVGEPMVPSATLASGGAWTVNFTGSQSWSSLSIFSESANEMIDELRIGTTWADVAPLGGVSTSPDSWWTNVTASAGSSWGDSNNWVNMVGANVLPGPGSANLTVAGASYTALYDSVQPAISNLTVQNAAPYRTDLIVSAPLTSLGGAAIRLLAGASVTLTTNGVWNYVGTNATTDTAESMLSIRNGGELNVNGGMLAFTNLPIATTAFGNYINVGYMSTGTLRVTSGRLEYYERGARATTNDNRSIRVGRGAGGSGTLEISGGAVLLGKANGSIGTEPLQVGVGSDASGTRGTVIVSGGSLVYTNGGGNTLMVGSYYGTGAFIVTNTGYVNLQAGGAAARAYVGQTPCGNGLLRMDGGYMTVGDGLNVGYNNGYSLPGTGVMEVTAGNLETGAGLVIGYGQSGAGTGVGTVNITGGRVSEGYWGVFVGRSRLGGSGLGRMTITNGLLDIVSSAGVGNGNEAHSGLGIGVIMHTDNNAASRAQGDVFVSGNAVITNAGVLVIGVNGATGTLTQTGGTIRHAPQSGATDKFTILGYGTGATTYYGGGNGTYEMYGGSYYTPNRVFVGGVPTNLQSFARAGGVGVLKVAGGSFMATNTTLMVGGNGTGTLMVGSNGVCFAKDIVFTNNTQSTLRCELGTAGLGSLTASGNLAIYPGAKLEVDSRAYRGGAVWIKLADCATRTGSFDPANITVTGQGVVRQDRDEDLWLYIQRGLLIAIY